MAVTGNMLPLSRHGIGKGNAGFVVQMTFERNVDCLFNSAVYSDYSDTSKGVTESVMVGRRAKIGTGCCDIMAPFEVYVPASSSSSSSSSSASSHADGGVCEDREFRSFAESGSTDLYSPANYDKSDVATYDHDDDIDYNDECY
jgi:hypothetical protein